MKSDRRTVYWTCIHGKRYSAALSKEDAEALIRMDRKELQTSREEWKIETEVVDLPLVDGTRATSEDGWPEVFWVCPHTGEPLHSALEDGEGSPSLLFTGMDERLALVVWE